MINTTAIEHNKLLIKLSGCKDCKKKWQQLQHLMLTYANMYIQSWYKGLFALFLFNHKVLIPVRSTIAFIVIFQIVSSLLISTKFRIFNVYLLSLELLFSFNILQNIQSKHAILHSRHSLLSFPYVYYSIISSVTWWTRIIGNKHAFALIHHLVHQLLYFLLALSLSTAFFSFHICPCQYMEHTSSLFRLGINAN